MTPAPELSDFAWQVLDLIRDRNLRGATVGTNKVADGPRQALLDAGAVESKGSNKSRRAAWGEHTGLYITEAGIKMLADHKAGRSNVEP